MPHICYLDKAFTQRSEAMIEHIVSIIEEYQQQGFALTLRQLYYQLVSRDFVSNTQQEYKRIGGLVNDARYAGLIDWLAIEDRTRNLSRVTTWETPAQIMDAAWKGYALDPWQTQPYYIEVWVEKEALAGVVASACNPLRVPYFSCRGYTSASEMWLAGERFLQHTAQKCLILHLGDHDPSGLDMTRDIYDRLELFAGGRVDVKRIALNMDQIEEYNPPPNPAKVTDSRFVEYQREIGDESWELDALNPKTLSELIEEEVIKLVNPESWYASSEKEKGDKEKLRKAVDFVTDEGDEEVPV